MILADHLGGHNNKTWTDKGTLRYFYHQLGCRTMLDVGCGPGGQVNVAKIVGYKKVTGVDGDHTVNPDILHDFTKDKIIHNIKYDLCWSVEFLEHVPEEYMDNYMPLFKNCKHIVCTSSLYNNQYHYCIKEKKWWIDQFEKRGFLYDDFVYREILEVSTMNKKLTQDGINASWLERNGMYFSNKKVS